MKRDVTDLNIDMYNGKWGAFDRKGNIAIPFIYDMFLGPDGDKDQFLDMAKDGKWGKVDLYGNVVVPFIYDRIDSYGENGLAAVKRDDMWGFVDMKGKEVVRCAYKILWKIDKDHYQVKKGGKWGLMDSKGKFYVKPVYDAMTDHTDGKALVQQGKTLMVIDTEGNQVSPYTWQRHGNEHGFHGESIIVTRNGKYGVINCFGQEWISCKWNYIKRRGESSSDFLIRDDEGNWYTSEQVCENYMASLGDCIME